MRMVTYLVKGPAAATTTTTVDLAYLPFAMLS